MNLETRIPPLIVMTVVAGAMWLARMAAPGLDGVPERHAFTAAGVLALGIACAIAGVLEFRHARTTVDPLHPEKASAVVDTGIYRVTRNPMYLGMLLVLIAWAIYLANAVTLAGPVAFVLYMNRFQILPEERALLRIFGEPYRAYLGRVRRWL